jgi:hypothetical protein
MQTFAYSNFSALNAIGNACSEIWERSPPAVMASLPDGSGLRNELLAVVLKAMKSRSPSFTNIYCDRTNTSVEFVNGLSGILQGAMSGELRKHGERD